MVKTIDSSSRLDTARELALLLGALVAQYRAMHGGEAPNRISVSADVFPSLESQKDPSIALSRQASGYTFGGIPIEPKIDQTLPFVLRP